MSDALEMIYNIYSSFIDCLFNSIELFDGVFLGWVFVAIFLTGVMIRSIISIPKGSSRIRIGKESE